MPYRGVIQYRGSPRAKAAALKKAVKSANASVVSSWHGRIMPGHFTNRARRMYRYKARAGEDQGPMVPGRNGRMARNRSYSWRKRSKKGHNLPLVWSGQSRTRARQMLRISSTSKTATGRFSLDKYFYAFKPGQPDKGDELTRVTLGETNKLARLHERLVTRKLNAVRTAETKRV